MNDQDSGAPRRWLWRGLQLLGTTLAFLYILWRVDMHEVIEAGRELPALSMAGAIGFTALNLVVGALRWRILMAAYGAMPPRLWVLVRLYYIGFFYNTYLPGGVGGDLVRGVVTRKSFEAGGTTGGLTVVFVERVLGLCGLLCVVAFVTAIAPPVDLPGLRTATAFGLLAGLGAVIGVAASRRLAPRLPRRLARIAKGIPELRSPTRFAAAFGLSLVTQSLVALTGWSLLVGFSSSVSLFDAFIVVPVAAATAFLPFTVGGAGAREAALVALATAVTDLSDAQAAAGSLLLWASQLLVAAVGGILQATHREPNR